MTTSPLESGKQPAKPTAPAPSLASPRLSIWGWLALVVILIAGGVTYSNSFRGAFVYDDFASIRDNPHIHRLSSLEDVFNALSLKKANDGATVARRPILSLSLALNYAVSQNDIRSYHLVNLIIHLTGGLLIFGIIRRTLCLPALRERWRQKSVGVALAVAVIWTVHPLQTESVTYIVQRAESLMGMFYLLTLYACLRSFQSANWSAANIFLEHLGGCCLRVGNGLQRSDVYGADPGVLIRCHFRLAVVSKVA